MVSKGELKVIKIKIDINPRSTAERVCAVFRTISGLEWFQEVIICKVGLKLGGYYLKLMVRNKPVIIRI